MKVFTFGAASAGSMFMLAGIFTDLAFKSSWFFVFMALLGFFCGWSLTRTSSVLYRTCMFVPVVLIGTAILGGLLSFLDIAFETRYLLALSLSVPVSYFIVRNAKPSV